MTLYNFRNHLLILVISLYLLLNYGFMQLRFPPVAGGGIPIGEVVLLFSLVTINYKKLLPRITVSIFIMPFLAWWLLGFLGAFLGLPEYGLWALRDATHVIESLFLIIGFSFAASANMLEKFFRWLPYLLVVVCVYSLGYPFRGTLLSISPKIIAGSGASVALFFNYTGTSVMLLLAVAYLFIVHSKEDYKSMGYLLLGIIVLSYTIFLFQSRTIYLQMIGLLMFFMLYRRSATKKFFIVMLTILIVLSVTSYLGIHIKGRLGQIVSIKFLYHHFLSIAGISSSGLEGAAAGIPQRIGWWLNLYHRWTDNVYTFLFGLGYGFPLIDFNIAQSVVVREPHNSYISIVAHIGLIGAIMWTWMHILLIKVWVVNYRYCKRLKNKIWQNRLLIFMAFFILIWINAIGEDAFEKPFFAIPYYFFWGIVLRVYYQLKSGKVCGGRLCPSNAFVIEGRS